MALIWSVDITIDGYNGALFFFDFVSLLLKNDEKLKKSTEFSEFLLRSSDYEQNHLSD